MRVQDLTFARGTLPRYCAEDLLALVPTGDRRLDEALVDAAKRQILSRMAEGILDAAYLVDAASLVEGDDAFAFAYRDAVQWAQAGITCPADFWGWLDVGVNSPDDAAAFRQAGYGPADAEAWLEAVGVPAYGEYGDLLYLEKGQAGAPRDGFLHVLVRDGEVILPAL